MPTLLVAVALMLAPPASAPAALGPGVNAEDPPVAIAIHGGAGVILRENMSEEMEAAYRAALEAALRAGHQVLLEGGSAVDAVTAAILPLEDSELFNAGHGAVLTSEGTVELDASIMFGPTRDAGAVAGVRHVKNPILAARAVMERSPHVMMVGDGAEAFVEPFDLQFVDNEYFITARRAEALRRVQERERSESGVLIPTDPEARQMTGTVGAVALDRDGNLAAATSTGGMTNKRWGRVGDSPIIGAGTYADDTCAVSATGHGEYFIRLAVAHAISARMRHLGEDIFTASRAIIHGDLTDLGGTGGVIAMDADGNVAMPFNTPGMYRGVIDTAGRITIELYGE